MEENYKLAKWLSGEMSPEELTTFKNDPDFSLFEKIKSYSSQLETPKFEDENMLSHVLSTPKKEKKVISLTQNWWFKIAAVLVVGLGLFIGAKNFVSFTEYAQNGVQNTFSLPDNSQVVLNSGSEIQYKKWNWDNQRSLNLKGEAFFKVAKGKKFEVITSLGKVTVLGTQFNVKQRDHRFDVTCYEGKVKVNYQNTEVVITKGKSVAFKNGTPIVIPLTNAQNPEWLNQELKFNQENLQSVIAELERHFNVSIVLETTNDNQLFTGIIPAKNIDIALDIIATTYHLKSQKISKNEIRLQEIDVQK